MSRLLKLASLTLCLLLTSALLISGQAQPLAPSAVLTVDAAQPTGRVSPYVFGANHGPWATLNVDMFPTAQAAGISFLRFPGGNWGDRNNLRPEQIDFFMLQAQAVGAEPSIHVRLDGGTPEQAAALVRYANIEKGYNIRYWGIGNEPDLYHDYTFERFNTEWRAIAEAMRAVDPDILLLGPEVSQYPNSPNAPEYLREKRRWVQEFLRVNGDLVDIVTIHRYPFPVGQRQTTIDDMRRSTAEWDFIIADVRAVVAEYAGGRDLPVAVTEVNSHWANAAGGEAAMDSHYNAIWWADVLGRLIRQQVEIVAYFTMATSGNQGAWGMIERYGVRPTYYVYPLYQRFGLDLVHAESDDADVTVYAALREDGALTLMVVNLATAPRSATLTLSGFTPGGDAEVWRLDLQHRAEALDALALADGSTLDLPEQSVTLYVIPAGQ